MAISGQSCLSVYVYEAKNRFQINYNIISDVDWLYISCVLFAYIQDTCNSRGSYPVSCIASLQKHVIIR